MTWEQIFLLCFPFEHFATLKDHIIEVSGENEWEPTLLNLVQFIAVELAMGLGHSVSKNTIVFYTCWAEKRNGLTQKL